MGGRSPLGGGHHSAMHNSAAISSPAADQYYTGGPRRRRAGAGSAWSPLSSHADLCGGHRPGAAPPPRGDAAGGGSPAPRRGKLCTNLGNSLPLVSHQITCGSVEMEMAVTEPVPGNHGRVGLKAAGAPL